MAQDDAVKLRTNPIILAIAIPSCLWIECLLFSSVVKSALNGFKDTGMAITIFVLALIVGYVIYRVLKNTWGYVLIIEDGILRYRDLSFGHWEQYDLRGVRVTRSWKHWDHAGWVFFFQRKLILETRDGRTHFIDLTLLWNRKLLFREIDKYALLGSFDYTREQAIK